LHRFVVLFLGSRFFIVRRKTGKDAKQQGYDDWFIIHSARTLPNCCEALLGKSC
jgi:hypothetical protein